MTAQKGLLDKKHLLVKSEFFLVFSIFYAISHIYLGFLSYILLIAILFVFFGKKSALILTLLIVFFHLIASNGFLVLYKKNKKNLYKTPSVYLISKKQLSTGTIVFCKAKKISSYKFKVEKHYFSFEIPFVTKILKFRDDFCEKIFNLSGGELTLPQALLFGNKSYLSNDFKDKFIVMGISHFLAVSGMHVGIILLIMFNFLFFIPDKIKKIIISILILFLIPIAGFKIPVIRAVVFSIILMTVSILDTKADLKKLLITIAGFFILFSPEIIIRPSFLLSFFAVYGIICFLKYDYNFLKSVLLAGVAATAFTLIFTLYFFGTYNIASIVNTIIFLPFVYLILCLSIFSLFFTNTSINPLILSEKIFHYLSDFLFGITKHLFVLNKISFIYVILILSFIALALYHKKIFFLLPVLIIPYFHSVHEKAVFIPNLKNAKAIVEVGDINKVFYLGNYKTFRYKFIPFLSKLKINKFEEGKLKIFGGNNYFIDIQDKLKKIDDLCINKINDNCSFVFITKSNKLNKTNVNIKKIYIIYKNKEKFENVIELKNYKLLKIKEGKLFYEN